ncbi:gamma-tubulin complex component 2-like isoform X1 [Onthophagus taurus]|uniref:gamma-tubulin complex component 2-like isoform X1 n=1 Tax=Onthophagus taurus TaxID=166361 RepID=UPI0039BDD4B0
MSEFKLHHLVKELLTLTNSKANPEELADYLEKHITRAPLASSSQIGYQNEVHEFAESCSNPQAFLSKYEELKQKNVDCLSGYVHLMYLISQDAPGKELLSKTCINPTISSSTSLVSPLTLTDLPTVKNKLKKAITMPSATCVNLNRQILNTTGLPTATTPSMNSWVQRRPTMSWDFSRSTMQICGTNPITNIPPSSQESMLIEDLLNILMGLPGCYIEALDLKGPYDNREFAINENIDPPLKGLIKQILPLASHYSIIQRFIEEKMRFEYGQVNNALAECMSGLVVEYMLFLTQIETEFRSENLNLHKMWFYLQNKIHSLGIISNIATTINKSDSIGGKVLSLLHEQISGFSGDYKAQNLCVQLMQAACVPYMKMLGMWIYKGIITDPIKEFLVEDNEVVQKEDMPIDYSADYWDKKYTVRRERIPAFLEPVSDIILRAGKYLNVIRQCGKTLNHKVETIEYKLEEKHYIEAIENAYKIASQTLLDLVMKEQDLVGRLKSVKHYFLLDQGDFIVTFLSLCEKELSKNINDVIQARLDSLMDLALRLSSATNDPYKDDLRIELLPYDLQFQMFKILSIQTMSEQEYCMNSDFQNELYGIQSFTFSYEVRWPLSLILNRRSLSCYQMIFRHLFYCKYVERMLCQVWRANKVTKKFAEHTAKQYRFAFALRQRMIQCVQNLEYHMMVEVIEPHWSSFLHNIAKVNNVDEVLTCHCDFLVACLRDCMLTIPNLLEVITNILTICISFCKFMQQAQLHYLEAELGIVPQSYIDTHMLQGELGVCEIPDETQMATFSENIAAFDEQFTKHLLDLLGLINGLNRDSSDHERLFNLLYRLDFENYYTNGMANRRRKNHEDITG